MQPSFVPSVCTRCQLRANNDRTPSKYDCETDEGSGFACSVCLGVLHESSIARVADAFSTAAAGVLHNGTLRINSAFPASVSAVRERAFLMSLRRTRAGAALVSLREAFKLTLAARIRRLFGVHYHPDSSLFLDVMFEHRGYSSDVAFVTAARPYPGSTNPHRAIPSSHVLRAVAAMSDEQFAAAAPPNWIPPPPALHPVTFSTSLSTTPVYLAGSYNKWSRIVSQTPWFVDDDDEGGGGRDRREGRGKGRGDKRQRGRGGRGRGRFRDRDRDADRRDSIDSDQGKENLNDKGKDKETASSTQGTSLQDPDSQNTRGEQQLLESGEPKKRTAVSVEDEVLAGVRRVLRPERAVFCAGGREDVDVRMLGSGRPFYVEVVNPKIVADRVTPELVRQMLPGADGAGTAVSVSALRQVSRDFTAKMKLVESDKRKHYRCVVWCSRAVTRAELERRLVIAEAESGTEDGKDENRVATAGNGWKMNGKGKERELKNGNDDGDSEDLSALVLHQKTPLRVLHRRTLSTRKKSIYSLAIVEVVSPHFFVMDLVAQAGTYIKEFVHGDCGRTVPSVCSLLECDADILQLDVVKVDVAGLDVGQDKQDDATQPIDE